MASPLVVGFIAAKVVTYALVDEGVTTLPVAAVGQIETWILAIYALASLLSLVLLFWHLRAAAGGVPGAEAFLARLEEADLAQALTLARERRLLSTQALAKLQGSLGGKRELLELVHNQRRAMEGMGLTLTSLAESLTQQAQAAQAVKRSSEERLKFHKDLTESIDALSHSAEESSSSVLQMVAINNEVSDNIHNLALSVQETTTAIEEMTFSSKEVAKNIEELSTAAEETAASMNEMDVSISQVETNANETAKLSDTVSRDAETGVTAINRTIEGIDKIMESSRVAANVIGSLGQKIDEIGNILNVIDDVAEQTNLLALNAAIIAAQAGEHGRGFAVVADEIKALAERTGASTKEIAGLIQGVQSESKNAISVMSQGVDDVEEGVRLGHDAEGALRKIVDSAKRSTLMIQAIAQATVEQAKGSKQVTNAISRIAETVQQIAFATAEQAKGSEHIMQSAERMKMITQQVERSSDEQNRGGRQVTEAIECIRENVERISVATRAQIEDSERAATVASQLHSANVRGTDITQQLERLLGEAEKVLGLLDERLER